MSDHGFIRRRSLDRSHVSAGAALVNRDRWYDPDFAPINIPLAVQANDSLGPYTLPMKCIRTESGWISGHTRTRLHVTVVGWRYSESGVRAS